MDDDILLTIWCSAYNMKEYIRDTFDGFLMQQTSFKWRVIVFDDASTDGTSDIVREYSSNHPDLFIAYISEENINSDIERKRRIINQLFKTYNRGKYIAECEGDDYWTDPQKLQKQVDFMEQHPDCSMVVHAAEWLDCSTLESFISPEIDESRYLTEWEVIAEVNGRPQTASFVYRSRDWDMDPKLQYYNWGEYPRRVYQFAKGKIFCFREPMSVYRFRRPGSWTSTFFTNKNFSMDSNISQQIFLEKYDRYTEYKYHDAVQMMINASLHDAYLLDPDCSTGDYWEILERCNPGEDNLKRYREDRERIGAMVRGTYSFSNDEKILLSKQEYVVIYGCGKCSTFIKRLLEIRGIEYLGYVVSNGKKKVDQVEGKPVWEMGTYPFRFEDTVVIIGLGQELEYNVRRELKKYHVEHCIDSFWIPSALKNG